MSAASGETPPNRWSTAACAGQAAEMLVFTLADVECAVDARCVREVRSPPASGAAAVGLPPSRAVSDRRAVQPLEIDLGRALGCAPRPPGGGVTLVLQQAGRTASVVVDAVSGVLTIPPGPLRPLPAGAAAAACAAGIATVHDGQRERWLLLLDVRRLLDGRRAEPDAVENDPTIHPKGNTP